MLECVGGTMMAAGVLTKGRPRGYVDLIVGVMQDARCQVRPREERLEARKMKRDEKAGQAYPTIKARRNA